MKIKLIALTILLPLFLWGQTTTVESTSSPTNVSFAKKTAFKPWMNPYWNSLDRQKVIPFKYPSFNPFSVPAGTYHNIKSRNALLNEKLSPYLNKVYQNSIHSQTINDLKQSTIEYQNVSAQQNFINRAISTLFFSLR